MMVYRTSYVNVFKRNFMLVLIAFVLLVPTFFIWAGIPVFVVGSALANLTTSQFFLNICVSLAGAFLFSLYFLPFNFKVAQHVATNKERSLLSSLIRIEIAWTMAAAVIFLLILSILAR